MKIISMVHYYELYVGLEVVPEEVLGQWPSWPREVIANCFGMVLPPQPAPHKDELLVGWKILLKVVGIGEIGGWGLGVGILLH